MLEFLPFFYVFFCCYFYFIQKSFRLTLLEPIGTELCMNVPWVIMHSIVVGIFDLSKNMAAVNKNRTYESDSSFLHISPKPLSPIEIRLFASPLTFSEPMGCTMALSELKTTFFARDDLGSKLM